MWYMQYGKICLLVYIYIPPRATSKSSLYWQLTLIYSLKTWIKRDWDKIWLPFKNRWHLLDLKTGLTAYYDDYQSIWFFLLVINLKLGVKLKSLHQDKFFHMVIHDYNWNFTLNTAYMKIFHLYLCLNLQSFKRLGCFSKPFPLITSDVPLTVKLQKGNWK